MTAKPTYYSFLWMAVLVFIVCSYDSACCAAVICPQHTSPTSTDGTQETKNLQDIGQLLDEVIASDALLGRPRVVLDVTRNSLLIDIKPAPLEFIGNDKVKNRATLEAALRIEVIRRDLRDSLSAETFWVKPVEDVEAAVNALLAPQDVHSIHKPSLDKENQALDGAFEKLQQVLLQYAREKHINIDATREPAAGFAATIKFDPYPVRVVVMPMLAYLVARKFGTSLEDQWSELTAGPKKMCGSYHYVAYWPLTLNGRVESNFDVLEDGDVILFRPGVGK